MLAPIVGYPAPEGSDAWCHAKEDFVAALSADPGAMIGSDGTRRDTVRNWVMDAIGSLRPGDEGERAQDLLIGLLTRAAAESNPDAIRVIDEIACRVADLASVKFDSDPDPNDDLDRAHDEAVDAELEAEMGGAP